MPNYEYIPYEDPTNYAPVSKKNAYNLSVINGKVDLSSLDLPYFGIFENPEEEKSIDVYDNTFVKDVNEEGIICIAGCMHSKYCTSIFKEVVDSIHEDARRESIAMLLLIKAYVKYEGKVNGIVETPFGKKYLDFGNKGKKIVVSKSTKTYERFRRH